MKAKLFKFFNSTGKYMISFCLAYAAIIRIGHFSLVLFGEPKFPEI